jgi:tricorn protease-like protein
MINAAPLGECAGQQALSRRASREAYAVPVDGGQVRRLTYWGDRFATVRGWISGETPDSY